MQTLDFSDFFQPIDTERISGGKEYLSTQFGQAMRVYTAEKGWPELEGVKMVLIGIQEERRAVDNVGCADGPDAARRELYKLFHGAAALEMADLGNIRAGHTPADTDYAIKTVMGALLRKNIIPILLGGGQDLTYAQYLAYEAIEQTVNLVAVDARFDLGGAGEDLSSQSYLSKIILHQPNFLFNYSNIGYQTYFVEQTAIDLMSKLNFDVHRLGALRGQIGHAEPIIRNADLVSFDLSAIRRSEAPANAAASPNGFSAEEACQLARYAGISDKLSSFGIYEFNPVLDERGQTAQLVAQMIWCFVEGYYQRKKDYPFADTSAYTRFRVFLKDHKHEIIFFKSNKSDRWWMEVPYPPNQKLKFERHALVPCLYDEYQEACKEEMPDRWWQTFQKLS